jgi:hypothetical protein
LVGFRTIKIILKQEAAVGTINIILKQGGGEIFVWNQTDKAVGSTLAEGMVIKPMLDLSMRTRWTVKFLCVF